MKASKIICHYCYQSFPHKMSYGGHIKNCTARKDKFESLRKLINSLRPLTVTKAPLQDKNKSLYGRGWKEVANFLKVHPQTAKRMYKKARRGKHPMPVYKTRWGSIMFKVDELAVWLRGEP